LATQLSTLKDLQGFFSWLAYQPGYKSKIHMPDIAYLNMGDKKTRIAKSSGSVAFPSLDQVRHVIAQMPFTTDVEKRDRALIAFVRATGVRDSALISLKLKHFNTDSLLITQDPREVKTKGGKWIETYVFPIDDTLTQIVLEWVQYLKAEKLFGPTDAIFPKTLNVQDANQCFAASGLNREHWQGTQAVRNIFKAAFEHAGLPYYHPHSLRHTLGHIGQQMCKTPEDFKAWSQNLGHEGVMTTLTSYGHMPHHRQGEVIKGLTHSNNKEDVLSAMKALIAKVS
jgi:integrase/recombinase XerD